jgi:hypothetical protein
MKAGTYYVGDLCYIMSHEMWGSFIDDAYKFQDGDGVFLNADFAIYSTMYGDGKYTDQFGNTYGVDSGSIGCINIDTFQLSQNYLDEAARLGIIAYFPSDFTTESVDGVLKFGKCEINTVDE